MTELVAAAFRHNRPELTLIYADETCEELLPEAAAIGRRHKGEPAAYLCAADSCQPAIRDPESLDAALGSLK